MILEKVVADKNVKRRKNAKNAVIILSQSENYNASTCAVCIVTVHHCIGRRKYFIKLERGGSCAFSDSIINMGINICQEIKKSNY